MKKFIGFILSACILFSLAIPAFAANDTRINESEDKILNLIENGITVANQPNKVELKSYKIYFYNYFLYVNMTEKDVNNITTFLNSVKTTLEAQVANGLVINNDGSVNTNKMSSANESVFRDSLLDAVDTATKNGSYKYTFSYDTTQKILTINDTTNKIPLTLQIGTIIKQTDTTGASNMMIIFVTLGVLVAVIAGIAIVAKKKKLFVK